MGSYFYAQLCCKHIMRPIFWGSESDPRTGTKNRLKNAHSAPQKNCQHVLFCLVNLLNALVSKISRHPLKNTGGCQPLAGATPRPAKTLLLKQARRTAGQDLRIKPGNCITTLQKLLRRALARWRPSRQRQPCGPDEPYLPHALFAWSNRCDLHEG